MKALLLLPLLASCASVPAISCDNADRVRAAAALALQAIERVCPAPIL